MTGTDTEFPACLYRALSEILGNLYVSGKPRSLKHSLGVSFRIPFLSTFLKCNLKVCQDLFSVSFEVRSAELYYN